MDNEKLKGKRQLERDEKDKGPVEEKEAKTMDQ